VGKRDRETLMRQVGEYTRGLQEISDDIESIARGLRRNAPPSDPPAASSTEAPPPPAKPRPRKR
jgi:hypothetical protein